MMDAAESLCGLRFTVDGEVVLDDFDPWSDIPDELNSFEYVEAKAKAEAITNAETYFIARRKIKTARQLYLNRRRRETPEGAAAYQEKLHRDAETRRERYRNDPVYRARRLSQDGKDGR